MILKTKFIGSSLEQCIGDACKLFDVEKDKLDYKIIKKKKGLFIKKVVIEAKPIEEKVEEVIKEKEVEEIETYNIEEKAKKKTMVQLK
ncbi:hypothetical protein EQG73_08385 [Clostridium tetani]|nr:hypothetical protein EQG73_08385 [Clostridium tetani]QBD87574.1 hypothetical protein EW636_08375 [Clostridium tetani]